MFTTNFASSSHNKAEPLICLMGSAGSEAHLPHLPLSLLILSLSYGVGSTSLKLEERHGVHA
jgi:hypothetical protein